MQILGSLMLGIALAIIIYIVFLKTYVQTR